MQTHLWFDFEIDRLFRKLLNTVIVQKMPQKETERKEREKEVGNRKGSIQGRGGRMEG